MRLRLQPSGALSTWRDKGWLISAIAPAYRGEFLEAVVGADVTINRIVADVLNKEIPWQGFLLLIGKSGTLLALPPQGEQRFELKERLFERFYRGESATGVAGSGLGMSIVKEIMEIHGGRIEIASRPLQGTTVTLWLPRALPCG